MFDPTINPNTVAATAAVLRWLSDGSAAARARANEQAHLSMLPDGRVPAVVAGICVGRFNMPRDPTTVEVTDWGALLEWCRQNRPDAVKTVTVEQVDPLFIRWLLDDARRKGAAVDADGVQVDGVTVKVRGAEPTMTWADDGQESLARALRDPQSRPLVVQALQEALSQVIGVAGVELRVPTGPGAEPQAAGDGAGRATQVEPGELFDGADPGQGDQGMFEGPRPVDADDLFGDPGPGSDDVDQLFGDPGPGHDVDLLGPANTAVDWQ